MHCNISSDCIISTYICVAVFNSLLVKPVLKESFFTDEVVCAFEFAKNRKQKSRSVYFMLCIINKHFLSWARIINPRYPAIS